MINSDNLTTVINGKYDNGKEITFYRMLCLTGILFSILFGTAVIAAGASDYFAPKELLALNLLFAGMVLLSYIVTFVALGFRIRLQNRHIHKNYMLQHIFENFSDALFIVSKDTFNIKYCNKSAVSMFKYADKNELTGKSFDIIVKNIVEARPPGKTELRLQTSEGTEFWGIISLTVMELQGENVLLVTVADISERKNAEEELNSNKMFIHRIADSCPFIVFIFDIVDNSLIYINNQCEKILGYTAEELQNMGTGLVQQIFHPDDFDKYAASINRRLNSLPDDPDFMINEYRVKNKRGEWNWLFIKTNTFQKDANGLTRQVIGTVEDIKIVKKNDAENIRLAAFPKENPLPVLACNIKGEINYINPAARRIMEQLQVSLKELLSEQHINMVNACISEHKSQNMEVMVKNIFYLWNYHFVPEVDVIHIYGLNITEQKNTEKQLIHDALHDQLTGLPNRNLFMDRLRSAINRAGRKSNYLFAVLFLDLDRFKIINDSLGHLIGDQLLEQVSERLKNNLRLGDTVARLGGDEFIVLLDDIKNTSDATRIADRIQKDLSSPFFLGRQEIFTTVSIGIALSSSGYQSEDDLLRNADMAMYRAKSRGKSRYEIYDFNMHEQALSYLKMETELRKAIDNKEIKIFYQPVVSLESFLITGFEALVRWDHPQRGMISPSEFLPVAEETGLIIAVDHLVLHDACRQARVWQEEFHKELVISVNISGKHFSKKDFISRFNSIITESGLNPKNLRLEITETMLMGNEDTVEDILTKLKTLDVQIQIDDFGTGYSSLNYLHSFPLNALKIDQSFIERMNKPSNAEIIQTIIMMANNLNIDVIAEGIETEEQLAVLKKLNCKYGQGYYFYSPLNADEASNLIASQERITI